MVKETKFFRKQAKKAERMARAVSDAEAAESLSNLAEAYRNQADVLKAKRNHPKSDAELGCAHLRRAPLCRVDGKAI
jgi:hypothetical protein